jgi:pimeloyl-ACP methyl ester carboxylesterase
MLYLNQEEMIFFPTKLPTEYNFRFTHPYQERYMETEDGHKLHGLLFKAKDPKGLIFYLHGNTGGLETWGDIAPAYTNLDYDIFMLDYRGFGKSEGTISSEAQFYDDVHLAYNYLKKDYPEEQTVILGYSIGTAAAARLAAHNRPKRLILQAPYYSLVDLVKKLYPLVPSSILKYKFKTCDFLPRVEAPVTIIHGVEDEVIYYGSSVKLTQYLKPGDEFVTLSGQRHNGFIENPEYLEALRKMLH